VKDEYLKRIIDGELDMALKTFGAVLIEGPKWCGKTMTAEGRAASALYMQDIDEEDFLFHTMKTKPSVLLEGETPRLIDEWQMFPKIWNGVRFAVDQRGGTGHFILTGSSVPKDDAGLHTGTGRITRLLMRPMTLFESLESNGCVSLRSLFNGGEAEGATLLSIEDIAFALVRGGWPESVGKERNIALKYARNYVETVTRSDISRVDDVERNPDRAERLMRSLARNESTPSKLTTIKNDVIGGDPDNTFADNTLYSYLNALRRMFVIEDMPAWSFDKRSNTVMQTSSKRYFIDPSIAAAALKISPEGLLRDLRTFGLLFESLCIRDMRVYAQANDGKVYHYRDRNGLEVDAVIEFYDGRWGAAEVKLGSKGVEEAAKNLMKFKEKVDLEKMGEPSFLMIVTATDRAYLRKDGVYIVPIGCLRD